eukprot:1186373-Amphidinium_carterae.1
MQIRNNTGVVALPFLGGSDVVHVCKDVTSSKPMNTSTYFSTEQLESTHLWTAEFPASFD